MLLSNLSPFEITWTLIEVSLLILTGIMFRKIRSFVDFSSQSLVVQCFVLLALNTVINVFSGLCLLSSLKYFFLDIYYLSLGCELALRAASPAHFFSRARIYKHAYWLFAFLNVWSLALEAFHYNFSPEIATIPALSLSLLTLYSMLPPENPFSQLFLGQTIVLVYGVSGVVALFNCPNTCALGSPTPLCQFLAVYRAFAGVGYLLGCMIRQEPDHQKEDFYVEMSTISRV